MYKHCIARVVGCLVLLTLSLSPVKAQIPIISTAVKKVLMAIDLQVQRMQNKTIWLQNAQKEMENILSETKLDEISGWVQKQKDLYQDYFQELKKVKNVIVFYHRIEEITNTQVKIVNSYHTAFDLFKLDNHFSTDELDYMEKVYTGIVDESLKNIDQVMLVINSFTTTMSDESRMQIIDAAADKMNSNYSDLKAFNSQNMILSMQRSKDLNNIKVIRQFYGLQ